MDTPQSLQIFVFYYFSRGFGLRGRQEHKQMKFGVVEIKKTTDDSEYLELLERNSKTMDSSKKKDFRPTRQIIYSTGEEDDPIAVFKKFIAKRPPQTKDADYPMYLTPIPQDRLKENCEIWYYRTPMGSDGP